MNSRQLCSTHLEVYAQSLQLTTVVVGHMGAVYFDKSFVQSNDILIKLKQIIRKLDFHMRKLITGQLEFLFKPVFRSAYETDSYVDGNLLYRNRSFTYRWRYFFTNTESLY